MPAICLRVFARAGAVAVFLPPWPALLLFVGGGGPPSLLMVVVVVAFLCSLCDPFRFPSCDSLPPSLLVVAVVFWLLRSDPRVR